MAESSADRLNALQQLIEQGKAVPMSASCVINRAEAVALVINPLPMPDHTRRILIDGDLAWRQHSGGHTVVPNWPTFLQWASRYIKTTPPSQQTANAK